MEKLHNLCQIYVVEIYANMPGAVASLRLSDAEIGDFVQVEGASIFDLGVVGERSR